MSRVLNLEEKKALSHNVPRRSHQLHEFLKIRGCRAELQLNKLEILIQPDLFLCVFNLGFQNDPVRRDIPSSEAEDEQLKPEGISAPSGNQSKYSFFH